MKRQIETPQRCILAAFLILMLFLGGWFVQGSAFAASGKLPGPGDILDAYAFVPPAEDADAAYLGLTTNERFFPTDLQAEFIILEVMNVYCASCQFMKPNMNELFAKVNSDADLKDRVKIFAVGAGNDQWDIAAEAPSYDFPLIPDEDYEFHRLVGQPPTPFLLFARPYSQNRLVVMASHLGRLQDTAALFQMVKDAYAVELSSLKIKPFRRSASVSMGSDGPPIPISETQLKEKVRQSLTINGIQAQGIDKIELPPWGLVYMGVLPQSDKRVFARVVGRTIPCVDCHDVFYIYSFDGDGNFLNFVPIAIYKYGNRSWNDSDISKVRQRFEGQSLLTEIPYNAGVDAVSSATISTGLIYDSIGHTQDVLKELARKGHLP